MVKKTKLPEQTESDSAYFLKIVLYVIIGSVWLKFKQPIYLGSIPFGGFPFGLIVGLLFASHDNFQIDRKIEYAILLIVTIVTFFIPSGIII